MSRTLVLALLVCTAVQAAIETPTVVGNWWAIAEKSPAPYVYQDQSFDWIAGDACDFTIWQSADLKWHLLACVRYTVDPATGAEIPRFFHHWETDDLRNTLWERKGIMILYVDGERRSMRAPHCFQHNGMWHIFHDSKAANAWISGDGRTFTPWYDYQGNVTFFSMSRDLMVFNDLSRSGNWISYFLQNPCGTETAAYVGARTATDLQGPWSSGCPVNVLSGGNPESPFVYRRGTGDYYLWTQMLVHHSTDPLNFAGGATHDMGGGRYAPEVVHDNGEFFIAGYANGIHLARFVWQSGSESNAYLRSLSVAEGSITPAFDSLTDHYVMTVPNSVTSVTVSAVASGASALVQTAGNMGLAAGKNTVAVTVTAQNGLDRRVYMIDVHRLAPGQAVYALTVNSGTGSGSFPAGAEVPVRASVPSGYFMDQWTGDTEHVRDLPAYHNCATAVVVMPSADVTLTPVFVRALTVTVECHDRNTGAVLDYWVLFCGYRQKVGSDGVQAFTGIRPGVHNLWVESFCENVRFTHDTTISLLFPLDSAPPAPAHTVSFVVRHNGSPVQDVQVSLRGTSLLTDAQGRVSFSAIPEGSSTYMVSCSGYRDFWGGLELGTRDTTVQVAIYLLNDVVRVSHLPAEGPRPGSGLRLVVGRPGRLAVDVLDLCGRRLGRMNRTVGAGAVELALPSRAAGCTVVRVRLDGQEMVEQSVMVR